MTENKSIWSAAAAPALALGGISIAYLVITYFIGKTGQSAVALSYIAKMLLWVAKFACCIILMKFFMKNYSQQNPDADNSRVFLFGMVVAALSALLFSAAYLGYVIYLVPDQLEQAFGMVMEQYSSKMDSSAISAMENLQSKLPTIYFFTNLIYCYIFGTVLSAIFSRNIPPRNPFQEDAADGQE